MVTSSRIHISQDVRADIIVVVLFHNNESVESSWRCSDEIVASTLQI